MCYSQNCTNYLNYHLEINRADSLIFLQSKPKEGLLKYIQIFNQYQNIFTKDLINAQSLSEHFGIKSVNFKKYLTKTQFFHATDGTISTLKISRDTFPDSLIRSRVDFDLRNRILELCAYDQVTKSFPPSSYERKKLYDTLFSIINRNGFPSELNVGLDDPLLTVRARLPHKSLEKYWKAIHLSKRFNHSLREEPEIIGFKAINLIMIHYPCAYDRLSKIITQEIEAGNIHPGEAALYYDNQFRFLKTVRSDCPDSFDNSIYFDHNPFSKSPSNFDADKTNIARYKLGLPSIELETAKKAFSDQTGIQLYWGFWGST
jgi:hypothetical protein